LVKFLETLTIKDLPKQSKMQTKSSDIVGEILYNPNDYLEFNYNFSADNNLESVNYNLFNSKIKVNNFVTTFEYLEENNEIGSN
jgi:LPS-assembly protein